jgi:multidrug efflux pump
MQDKNIELMEKAPIPKAILSLALPTVFSSIVILIYNLADTYFIGMLDDMYQLGAVSLAYPIFTVVQAIGNIFAIGVSPYISRCLGAQEHEKVKKASSVAIWTSAIVTLVLTAIYFIFNSRFLNMLGTDEHTFAPTKQYLDICILFGVFMTLQTVMSSFLRAEGKIKYSVIGMIIGSVSNIILDPIFILPQGLNMGVGGAAWATIIGNAVSVIFFVIVFFKGKATVSIRLRDFKPSKAIYSEVVRIGIPSSAGQILMGITNMVFNVLAVGYGDYVIPAYGVAGKMIFIAITIVNGYTSGYMPFAGYNFGAKNMKRVRSAFKFTVISSTVMCLVLLIPFLFLARTFMGAFNSNPNVIDTGVRFLQMYAICLPFLGLQFTFMSTLQVLGKAFRAMIVTIGRQTVFFFPLIYTLNHFFGFSGLIITNSIADIITTLVAFLLAVAPLRQMMKVSKEVA